LTAFRNGASAGIDLSIVDMDRRHTPAMRGDQPLPTPQEAEDD